ncbi:MAG TPA: type II toxin-antitoxin system HicA family toxin [Hyphomicrobiaceae bacterium]|jgi:predicted RNA binding protein YcfA (HicA-like mRNA interferase family)
MTKSSKVLDRVKEGQGTISFRDFERLLLALGFRLDRTSGSHRIYLHPQVSRPFSVQPRGNDAKPYQVRQLREMIEEFNLKL